MNRSRTVTYTVLLLLASAMCASAARAATLDLTGQPYVLYGDGQSYSLPILCFVQPCPNNSQYNVMAGPGQIDLFTKLGTQAQHDNAIPNMDDAFDTPQANNIPGFRLNGTNEPTPDGFAGDRIGWWDATLAALSAKLDLLKNSIVFFFANNETGSGDHLAAYARVELTQISTNTSLGFFELTNDFNHDGVAPYGAFTAGGGILFGDPTTYTSLNQAPVVADFLQSGGEVCIGPGNTAPCYQHNLGGDRAAYAVVFPELDALISALALGGADLTDYALHVDYRLGCGPEGPGFPQVQVGGNPNNTECDPNYAINGGAEKIFLGTQSLPGREVPEPSSMLLGVLALLGVVYARRKNTIKRPVR